jgi:hypothetical protein
MNDSEPPADVPSLGLSLTDVRVLTTMLGSYLVYLRRGVSPSKKRDREMVLLADIHNRMVAMLSTEGGMILLTTADIEALADALQSFITLMPRMIAPSEGRNEALKQMRALRGHVLGMLEGKSFDNDKRT